MRKRMFTGSVGLLALLLGASGALAHSATVAVLSPASGLSEVSTFPVVLDIEVKFTHGGGTGQDLCGGTWEILVTGPGLGDDGQSMGGAYVVTAGTPPTCSYGDEQIETWENFSFPEPGTYEITGKYDRTGSGHDGDDTIAVTYQEVTLAHPAAPAVAARILAQTEVPARWGSGRTGGNYISEVAHHMGSQAGDVRNTHFNGVSKSSVAAYRGEVCRFLQERLGATGDSTDLGCPSE